MKLATCKPGDVVARDDGTVVVVCGPIAHAVWVRECDRETGRDLRRVWLLPGAEDVELLVRGVERWPKGGAHASVDPLGGDA